MISNSTSNSTPGYDFDWLVIGSGFGGGVAALRLAEKGYRVGVLEAGRRFDTPEDFPKSTWDLRRYLWAPKLGCKGPMRMSLFKDVFITSGAGVGGGSLVYAMTLYRPRQDAFYTDPQWTELADWRQELAPYYDEAERMLGVTDHTARGPADRLLRELGEELGVADTFGATRVGTFFGEPGKTVPDPYFGGEGPERAGCIKCGRCIIGCPNNAKNSIDKNYLWLAERRGVTVMPQRMVVDIVPLGAGDGSAGYVVTSERSGRWVRKDRRRLTAGGVVLAAGALGTNQLLQSCKVSGSLPRVSSRLGHLVRTNAETVLAVTARDADVDFSADTIAITSSIHPKPDTHIETFTYGAGGDSTAGLMTLLTPEGTRRTRALKLLGQIIRHPIDFLRLQSPVGWSRRTLLLLVMQTVDTSMRLQAKRKRLGRGVRLQTEQNPERPNPTFIPAGNWAARRLAEKIGGIPQSSIFEALGNIPTTAHILGGAPIGADDSTGVIDSRHRVFGYSNLVVCDGAAVPANIGVNPALTITAMAERAMTFVPERSAS